MSKSLQNFQTKNPFHPLKKATKFIYPLFLRACSFNNLLTIQVLTNQFDHMDASYKSIYVRKQLIKWFIKTMVIGYYWFFIWYFLKRNN